MCHRAFSLKLRNSVDPAGGHFIWVSIDDIAENLGSQQTSSLVGVGNSGADLAKRIQTDSRTILVETLKWTPIREDRVLKVDTNNVKGEDCTLVDDVSTSGLTIQKVIEELGCAPRVLLGMRYKSKSARKRMGVADLYTALTYSMIGGGRAPINTISSLKKYPDRLDELDKRYFKGFRQFSELIRRDV